MKTMIQNIVFVCCMLIVGVVKADTLYEVETSGIMFKDTLSVERFNDPDYPNIACYVNLPSRSLSFDDQTDVAMQCASSSKIEGKLFSKRNIFSEKKGIFFKEMQIDRIYDKQNGNMIYISYTKKMSGDNASSAITIVPVGN